MNNLHDKKTKGKPLHALIITLGLSGCQQEEYTRNQSAHKSDSIIAPIIEQPYLKPLATNATTYTEDGVLHGDTLDMWGSKICSIVSEEKSLSEYEINPVFMHRYRVRMDIVLSNGLCVSAFHWHGVEWSDANVECDSNRAVYSQDDFMNIYGSYAVAKGKNFTAYLLRDGGWSVKWGIR